MHKFSKRISLKNNNFKDALDAYSKPSFFILQNLPTWIQIRTLPTTLSGTLYYSFFLYLSRLIRQSIFSRSLNRTFILDLTTELSLGQSRTHLCQLILISTCSLNSHSLSYQLFLKYRQSTSLSVLIIHNPLALTFRPPLMKHIAIFMAYCNQPCDGR